MKYLYTIFSFLFTLGLLNAQQPTTGKERLKNFEVRKTLQANSIVNAIPFRSVGPTVMGGRIVDLAVNPDNPTFFYVAYASGGLWRTKNNGISFEPLFENEAVMTIGDIAVDWSTSPETIWLGSGENNSSRSSFAGLGMYKSKDEGKTWEHLGLEESHHIGRIVLHPENSDVAWVAVLGHLYSPNKERGVYKTTDGGKTWELKLFVDENAGAIDLVVDPKAPNQLYAAIWERERRAWNFVESGSQSGIYKSADAGENWSKVTGGKSGFPDGEGVGRIGLSMYNDGKQNVLFAVLDNYNRRPQKKEKEKDHLTKKQLKSLTAAKFLELKNDKIKAFIKNNRFPKTDEFKVKNLKKLMKEGKITPQTLVEYLEDANSLLFDTEVVGAEVYKSLDGGKSWVKTHKDYLDEVFYSYGYYFAQIRVSPINVNDLYIMGVPILKSKDGGATWTSINRENVHVDHHALWVNPRKKGHLINGNDGGLNISYDDGEHWVKCNTPAVAQFYAVHVDRSNPYNIYGGTQDNGVWRGSHKSDPESRSWYANGENPFKEILGGDGMQIAVDSRDNTVYTGYQFGNYFRIKGGNGRRTYITPKPKLGSRPYRFNWQTPIHLSIHNEDILYMGANKLLRSMNKGDDFNEISKDLTNGGKKGDVAFGTLTSINESSLKFGLLYTGSDDGKVFRTDDGGNSWNDLSAGLPKDLWVTTVVASSHQIDRVYLSLNGYRHDDFKSYIYRSDDLGRNWKKIGLDLPSESVNVIYEDPFNEQLLYVGTDHGLYVSLNGGESFMGMNNGFPAVSVHDVIVQPDAKDLIVGTHGRSIYVVPVGELQQMNTELIKKPGHLFPINSLSHSSAWGNSWNKWQELKDPEFQIPFYSKVKGTAIVRVNSSDKQVLHEFRVNLLKGLNRIPYDLSITEDGAKILEALGRKSEKKKPSAKDLEPAKNMKIYLPKGEYLLEVETGGKVYKEQLVIE